MLLGCVMMLGVALLINNMGRQFPMYWWTPEDLRRTARPMLFRRRWADEAGTEGDEEKTVGGSANHEAGGSSDSSEDGSDGSQNGERDGDAMAAKAKSTRSNHAAEVVIRPGRVIVPEHMYLTQEEEQLLESEL